MRSLRYYTPGLPIGSGAILTLSLRGQGIARASV
ncbi:hypothetical protein SBDP1_120021 [Syntrophobacter sp. SbD1]|nr:hypothetical protein SBDP1_120021 [Syntrophobacter sp. SbD1]